MQSKTKENQAIARLFRWWRVNFHVSSMPTRKRRMNEAGNEPLRQWFIKKSIKEQTNGGSLFEENPLDNVISFTNKTSQETLH